MARSETQQDFSAGSFADLAGYLVPAQAYQRGVDVLTNVRGKVRKRGGTTNLISGSAETATSSYIGRVTNPLLPGGGSIVLHGANGHFYYVNPTTGAKTDLGAIGTSSAGRGFEWNGFYIVPQPAGWLVYAGSQGTKAAGSLLSPGSLTWIADEPILTLGGSDTTTGFELGQIITITATSRIYRGRVEEIFAPNKLRVYPPLPATFTPTGARVDAVVSADLYGERLIQIGGVAGCAHQDVLVFGNCSEFVPSRGDTNLHPRRLCWTIGPLEQPVEWAGIVTPPYLINAGIHRANYQDFPDSDPITAVASISGQLVVLGVGSLIRVTGLLSTQSVAASSVTWDHQLVSATIGCLNERAVRATPYGLVFASRTGLFGYDGARLTKLLDRRWENKWQADLDAGGDVIGTSLAGDHLIVSRLGTTSLVIDLGTLSVNEATNLAYVDSADDPTSSPRVFALRWWDTNAAAPSFYQGQVHRIDSIVHPSASNSLDADDTPPEPLFRSRVFTNGDDAELKTLFQALIAVRLNAPDTTDLVVKILPGLDSDVATPETLGTTIYQFTRGEVWEETFLSFARNLQGFAYQLELVGEADVFEIHGLRHLWDAIPGAWAA